MAEGTALWQSLEAPSAERFPWKSDSTYINPPPFFAPQAAASIKDAYCLLLLGDSVTTDHISPVSRIPPTSDAGKYLGKTEIYHQENLVGPFLGHKLLGPPRPLFSSNTSLGPTPVPCLYWGRADSFFTSQCRCCPHIVR